MTVTTATPPTFSKPAPVSRRRGFSLIELVIVVVIIGIIAAIAIPRMSRGSAGASDAAIAQNLAVLRGALDMYQTDHDGKFPVGSNVANLLTQYSNIDASSVSPNKNDASGVIYGPYLRAVPTMTGGTKKGKAGIAYSDTAGVPAVSTAASGWLYNSAEGSIAPDISGADATGKNYNTY